MVLWGKILVNAKKIEDGLYELQEPRIIGYSGKEVFDCIVENAKPGSKIIGSEGKAIKQYEFTSFTFEI